MDWTRPVRGGERAAAALGTVLAVAGVATVGIGAGFAAQRAVDDGGGGGGTTGRVSTGAVPVYDCPGDPAVADLHDGDRIFAIGVNDEVDGWLLIRNPENPAELWWVADRYIDTDSSTGDLPALACGEEPAAETGDGGEVAAGPDDSATTTIGPDGSTTTTGPDGSTTTTEPGATTTTQAGVTTTTAEATTTTTTAAPDTTGPFIGSLSRSRTSIYENHHVGTGGCPAGSPTTAQISASVNDPSGLKSVRMWWSISGGGSTESGSKSMTYNVQLGKFTATLGPFGDVMPGQANETGTIAVTVEAVDNANNSATSQPTTVTLYDCTFG